MEESSYRVVKKAARRWIPEGRGDVWKQKSS